MRASVAAMAALALLAAGCSSDAGTSTDGGGGDNGSLADMEPVELTFNHTNPSGGHFEAGAVAFTEYVEEATDGKITFQTLYSGSLLSAAEAFSGTGAGVADVSYTTTIGFDDEFPVGTWLSAAMTQGDRSFPLGPLANDAAVNEVIATEPSLQAEYEAQGVHPLWFVSATPGDMLCVDPIEGLSDASEYTSRSGGGQLSAELDALGMTSVSLPFADLYEGLQRGAIDCVYTTAGNTTFKPYGLTEVAKNYLPLQGWTPVAAAGFIMNLDRYNSFPDEVKQIFDEAAIEAMAAHSEGAYGVVADFGATAKADGVNFMETEELRGRFTELHDELYENMAETAPSGVEDPEQLIASLRESQEKWTELFSGEVVDDAAQNYAIDGEKLRAAYEAGAESIDWESYHSLLLEEARAQE